ncbi:MAG: PqqD family protein [Planctomycetota bacterium]|jgi:hypothetical protein
MTDNRYPARARGVASRIVGGEAVVVVPKRREAHVLNETGSAVWSMMDGSRAAPEIASELAARYGIEGDAAARDLEVFMGDLESRGAAGKLDGPSESLAPRGAPPEPTRYEPPAVAESHPMEVVAALCASTRTGAGGSGKPPKPKPPNKCRVDPSMCFKTME